MKWYDVKEHWPAISDCMYLVRLSSSEVFIATLEMSANKESCCWISDDGKYFDDYHVTHFSIIEPIEVK